MKELEYLAATIMPVNGQKELLHEVAEETEQCETIKTRMPRAYNPWRAAYLTFVNRYETPLGNVDITKPIHQLDSQRDSVLFAIEVTARAAMKSIDPATVAAAEAVEQARISFPVDPNAGYLSQTAQLDFYLAAMLGPQLENVTKIGALPLVENLKAINDQIHELVSNRDDDRADEENEPGRTAARLAAIEAWQFLRKFVNGYNLVVVDPAQPDAALDRYIDRMNVKIRRYKSIYLGGSGKPEDKPEDGEGTEEAPEGTTPPEGGEQQPDNTPDTNPDDNNQGDNSQGGGGSLTPDTNPPGGDNNDNTGGGNTNPGGGYVPPSNGGGFD